MTDGALLSAAANGGLAFTAGAGYAGALDPANLAAAASLASADVLLAGVAGAPKAVTLAGLSASLAALDSAGLGVATLNPATGTQQRGYLVSRDYGVARNNIVLGAARDGEVNPNIRLQVDYDDGSAHIGLNIGGTAASGFVYKQDGHLPFVGLRSYTGLTGANAAVNELTIANNEGAIAYNVAKADGSHAFKVLGAAALTVGAASLALGADAGGARTLTVHSGATGANLAMSTNAAGNAFIAASSTTATFTIQAGWGITVTSGERVALISAANCDQIFRAGGNFTFQDVDAANAVRAALASATGNLSLAGALGLYAAPAALADGDWQLVRSGADLLIQKRVAGAWVTKSTITGA